MADVLSRRLVRGTVICLLLFAARAPAQKPAAPDILPPYPAEAERPAAYVLPPPDAWTTAAIPSPDPLIERPGSLPSGLFFNVEPNILGVHFRNELKIPVVVSDTRTDLVQFFGSRLDDTVAPRFELGYRLPDGWGAVVVGYRFLNTQGSQAGTFGDQPVHVSGRVALNSFDVGYASQEFALGPAWDMRWGTGIRTTIFYYDARLQFDQPASDPGTILNEREVNYFWGLGPWVGLDLSRKTMIPGLSIFGRISGALQYGSIRQTGIEQLTADPEERAQEFRNKQGFEVTVLQLVPEAGLSYTAPGWNQCRFLLGYHYESFFQIGRFDLPGNVFSRGQLDTQGLFLRAEFNF
jgi:hypothetical protein